MTVMMAREVSRAPQQAPYPRRWYTLIVLCVALLVIVVDATIVNVALPTFARDLRAGTADLQWIVDAYTLTFAALLLVAGAITDRFGRHHALTAGLAVFGAGSLAAALTGTAAELIAARVLMGVGAAFIMPATLSILMTVFTDPAERSKAIGLWAGVSGLGVAIGPVAGGLLLAHYSWGSIFLVNLPIVAIALAAAHWLVPASRAPQPLPLDLPGAVASVAAFSALTYTIIEAPANGWLSGKTLGLAAASAALLALFIRREASAAHPMLPLTLFRNPRFTGAAVTLTILFFALSGAVFMTTQIYQFLLGFSPLAAGVRALPVAAALAVFSPLGANISKRHGVTLPVTLGLCMTAAGLAFYATASAVSGYGHYVIAMATSSAGIGLAMSATTTASMGVLPPALAGVGSAINDSTRNMGSVLGVAVFGSISASIFASQMTAAHMPASSVGAAAITAARTGNPDLLRAAAGAFVSGADHAVIAGVIAGLAGALVAIWAFRRRSASGQPPAPGQLK